MPPTLTYPGVYIEEIPSGVRPIAGVATSIAAFVGWSAQGPVGEATHIYSFDDYTRYFGALDPRSYLGYAVYHFFLNGGSEAYVVRLAAADATTAQFTTGGLTLSAQSPGAWGKDYFFKITAANYTPNRFRLSIGKANPLKAGTFQIAEQYENLSLTAGDSRNVVDVLSANSMILTATVAAGATAFTADVDWTQLTGGVDGAVLDPATPAPFNTALEAANGYTLLTQVDLFNLLIVPGLTDATELSKLQQFCLEHRAFLIADAPDQSNADTFLNSLRTAPANALFQDPPARNSALYFPWVQAPDAQQEGRVRDFPPSGFLAGIYARTDLNRGVWKAPAGTEAGLTGAAGLAAVMNDTQNGNLNTSGVNCLRSFPVYGNVVWGARTLAGSDQLGSDWKYISVRRMTLFIEESLFRGTKWVVFEPNDEPLWAQIRLNVGAFMDTLFRQRAFQGASPRDAYFVKCDSSTTTQNDINRGVVNVVVGFAPLKPAEFVVIQIQQMAGQVGA